MKKRHMELNVSKGKMSRVLIFLLFCGLAIAAAAEAVRTLTLSEAIKIALENNPGLEQAANQVKLNYISVKQKKANFYPDLRIYANLSKQYYKTPSSRTGNYESDESSGLTADVSANVNLFNGFYDTASLQQSRFELEAATGNLSRAGQAVVFEALQRYIQVVTSRELIEVEQENLEAQRLQLTRIEDFCKAGRRPVTDLYQQKAEISRSEYQLLNSRRDHQVNKFLLLQTLGLEAETRFRVADPEIDLMLSDIENFKVDEVLSEALQKRPDVTAQHRQIEAARKGIKAAQSGYWPSLSLVADLETNYSSTTSGFDFSSQFFNNSLNAAIGLSLTIPVFDKGTTKNNVAAARVRLKNQQLELKKLKDQVNVEVQQAVENRRTAVKQVKAAESQLDYAAAALESVEARYNVHSATMVELTQARARYLEAAYDRIIAKYNLLLQTIAVTYYTGDGDTMMAIINKKGE